MAQRCIALNGTHDMVHHIINGIRQATNDDDLIPRARKVRKLLFKGLCNCKRRRFGKWGRRLFGGISEQNFIRQHSSSVAVDSTRRERMQSFAAQFVDTENWTAGHNKENGFCNLKIAKLNLQSYQEGLILPLRPGGLLRPLPLPPR